MRSFCCTSKHRLPYHYRCPKCQDQLPGEENPSVGRSQEKLPRALNFKVFQLIETVQTSVSSTDGDFSFAGFEDVTPALLN